MELYDPVCVRIPTCMHTEREAQTDRIISVSCKGKEGGQMFLVVWCCDSDEGVSLDVGCRWVACRLCVAVCQLVFQEFAVEFINLQERSLARRFLPLCGGEVIFLVIYVL